MKAVADAIWAEWDGAAGLKAVLPNLHFQHAPSNPDSEFPYGVFTIVAGSQDDAFNEEVDEFTIQFNLYSNPDNNSATEIFAIYDAFTPVYDYVALTIPGWNATWCRRVLNQLTSVDGVYDYLLQYSVRCSR